MQSGTTDSFVSVYSDARHEYMRQLGIFLVPAYFKWYISLFEKAKETTANEPKKALWQFQNYLNEIPDWNMEKVTNEINLIQQACSCDYIEDLLTAVFIAHTKVLTAIRLSSKQKKVQITVPKVEHFLFKVLCETGKLLWGSSYLFSESLPSVERQKNYRQIENLISEGIHQAIRAMVPVKTILKDFINQDGGADENDGDMEGEGEGDGDGNNDIEESDKNNKEIEKKESVSESSALNESESATGTVAESATGTVAESATGTMAEVESETIKNITDDEKPIINLDSTKQVLFTEFDTVFKPSDPEASEIVYEPKDNDSDIESDNGYTFDLSDSNELQIEPDNEISQNDDKKGDMENDELKIDDAEILA